MKPSLVFSALLLFLCSSYTLALDIQRYNQHAEDSIRMIRDGRIDIQHLITLQEQLIRLGVTAIKTYGDRAKPHATMLREVAANAERMKNMSLTDIEQQWHRGGFLKTKGYSIDALDHFGAVNSLMDAVIHPATAYICLKNYQQHPDQALLDQVVAELTEVMEHIKFVP